MIDLEFPELYINKIMFNDGSTLDIEYTDLVLFVGGNNVGKTQVLKDIFSIANDTLEETIIVKKIEFAKNSENITPEINNFTEFKDGNYYGLNFKISDFFLSQYKLSNIRQEHYYSTLNGFFMNYLDTENRLSAANPPNVINQDDTPNHPIQLIERDKDLADKISYYFNKAFQTEVIPDSITGTNIVLRLGDSSKIVNGDSLKDIIYDTRQALKQLRTLHTQGDGMRSYMGLLLNLVLPNYRTILIDEPETFLHPPQARIIGEVIGELTKNKQVLLSTHNLNVIKGILSTHPDRVKIIRITRENNSNKFHTLDNKLISEILNDTFLSYSNVIDSLFYENTVLVESDSDARMYEIILNNLETSRDKYSNTLFIYCGGKGKFHKVIKVLKQLKVNYRAILDLDVLNNKNTLKNIYEASGGLWHEIDKDYRILNNQIQTKYTKKSLSKKTLQQFIDNIETDSISNKNIENIKKLLNNVSSWDNIKKYGINAIPSGDARKSYNSIKENLLTKKIHLVEVGELENFIRQVGGHGTLWVTEVIENYSDDSSYNIDINNEVFIEIKDFVSSWEI